MNLSVLLHWHYLIFLLPFAIAGFLLLLSSMHSTDQHAGHSGGGGHGEGGMVQGLRPLQDVFERVSQFARLRASVFQPGRAGVRRLLDIDQQLLDAAVQGLYLAEDGRLRRACRQLRPRLLKQYPADGKQQNLYDQDNRFRHAQSVKR